jgi:glycosyltransferase involved in cell wall biosynthesis
MYNNQKIAVVLPAYNAAKTLGQTYNEIPLDIVDFVILVDDASSDNTVEVGKRLGIRHIIVHEKNGGYGANQKSCYKAALDLGADIVIMLHPDYQYTPKLILPMAGLLTSGLYDTVLASRILGKGALRGGMPLYKYFFNRILTFAQNLIMNQKLSEYHTGYRAFTADVLRTIAIQNNSDDFVFDNEMLAQVFYANFKVAEISCPTRYFPEASSINFKRSMIYGMGCMLTALKYRMQKWGIGRFAIFK